jgi:hypothetical protein
MDRLSDSECLAFLRSLFPGGVKDEAVISELCPEGWESSPLFACFHPSPERSFEEHLKFRRNMRDLFGSREKDAMSEDTPEPDDCTTFAEYLAKHPPEPVVLTDEAKVEEPAELIGLCLWDVFSDNHDVVAADGRLVHLGSFRGSGGTIAEFFEASSPTDPDSDELWTAWDRSDYMRFYMGTAWIGGRADLTPVYRLIFRRIRGVGGDWRYSFPRLHIIDFGEAAVPESPTDYDPSAAFAREQELLEREAKTARLKRELEEDATRAMREARTKEPPETVRAYQSVFGRFPSGWPPDPYGS